jgi:predicted transcriptional regulator
LTGVAELFFELSNDDRLSILSLLREEPRKLTELSSGTGITHQQCTRHLKRLLDVQLITRNDGGHYEITNYGALALQFTPSLRFITEHREYWNAHTPLNLPPELLVRLGSLVGSRLMVNVMESISEIELMVKNSSKYLSVIIDKRTHSIRPHVASAVKRGIQVKSVSPPSYVPSVDVKREINFEDELAIIDAELSGQAVVADQEEFPVYLWLTEKAVFISFPLLDGSYDYTGFFSSDRSVVQLGLAIFEYYWGKTDPIPATEAAYRHRKYIEYYGYESK